MSLASYHHAYADCENNIFTLPDATRAQLVSRIAKHRGNVKVYVHPFFLFYAQYKCADQDVRPGNLWWEHYNQKRTEFPSIEAVEQSFRNAVRTHSFDHRVPVLVFEEGHRIQNLIQEIRSTTILLPYIIPTMRGNPIPLVAGEPLSEFTIRDAFHWLDLREQLRSLGVLHIQIGGMFSDQCVQDTYHELQKSFYVEPSLPLHPAGKNLLTAGQFSL